MQSIPTSTGPTFIGIGAARSGTTTLHDYLERHPQAFVPRHKEVHYFSFAFPSFKHPQALTEERYRAIFAATGRAPARGEISPSYLWFLDTAKRIHEFDPKLKLIAMLRNPVERFISDYSYGVEHGEIEPPIEEFVDAGIEGLEQDGVAAQSFHPTSCLWKGLYGTLLQPYLQAFPRDQLLIILLDDLVNRPVEVQEALCRFLEIETIPSPFRMRNASHRESAIPLEVYERLHAFYQSDIDITSRLIGRDLGAWLR